MSDLAALELSTLGEQPDSQAELRPTPTDSVGLASDLAPVDGGWKAWTFVVSSFILETFIWGFGFSFGIFQDYYRSSPDSPFYGASPSSISAIGTTSLAVQYIFGFLILIVLKVYARYVKAMLWSCLAVACGCFILSSFATQIWHLVILQGVILGAAGGVLYGPALLWLSEWFVERRGLAGGLIFCGSGVGGALFPPLLGTLLEKAGFRWTLRIWGAAFAVFAGAAIWFIQPRIPASRSRDIRVAPVDWSFLVHPTFLIIATTNLIQSLGYFPVSLYIPTYTSSLGLPALDGQLVLSTFNMFSVIGQIIFGYLCDRMSYSRVVIISGLGSALAAYLLWGYARNLGLIFAFAILFGCLGGGFSSIEPPAAAEISPNSLSSGVIVGLFGAVKGVAAIVGPLLAGSLYNPMDAGIPSTYGLFGFEKVTLFVGGMMIATAAGGLVSATVSHVRQRHRDRRS